MRLDVSRRRAGLRHAEQVLAVQHSRPVSTLSKKGESRGPLSPFAARRFGIPSPIWVGRDPSGQGFRVVPRWFGAIGEAPRKKSELNNGLLC